MRIRVNSKEMELEEGMTVEDLKSRLGIGGMTAVAVNGSIVRGSLHSTHVLADGDEVVAIGAAYGG